MTALPTPREAKESERTGPSTPEWRRLAWAIAFFTACLAAISVLFAIGFYH